MRQYNEFKYEKDFIRHSPHLYYLLGKINDTNTEYILASYSTKTKRLIIRDASSFDFSHPYGIMLNDFINGVEKYEKEHSSN